jgi:hypothetical protein
MNGIKLNLSLSGSGWDKNKLSEIGDSDNFGFARKIFLEIVPQNISIANLFLGKVGFSFLDRFIQNRFTTLDRIDEIEFNRNYNITAQSSLDQTLREFSLFYSPQNNISLNTKYGSIKLGDVFNSNRIFSRLNISSDKNYQLDYIIDYVSSKNNLNQSNWIRQSGQGFYSFNIIKPGLSFLYEDKEEKNITDHSLLQTSLKFIELVPAIEFNIKPGLEGKISYSIREESFPLNGIMKKQSDAIIKSFQAFYRGIKEFSTSLTMTLRDKKFTKEFLDFGYVNNETILFLSQSRFNLWNGFINGDVYYQAATEQSAKLEKVFLKVPKGNGSYVYLGDLNNNGFPDENEFQLSSYDADFILVTVPTDKLFPVIDLKANTRWKIEFASVFNDDSFWSKILKPISSETSWRIEENNKSPKTKNIYLLKLSNYLNDSTTIRGTQLFQQDINMFQNNNDFSFRLRFIQRKSLNQFSGGLERGYFKEWGIRFRFRMIEEINNQTEFSIQTDNLISPPSSNRARTVDRSEINSEFSYRPEQNIEFGFKISAGRSEDRFPTKPLTVDMNSVILRLNLSFENIGRLRIETERTELISSSNNYLIPYEITRGNVIGKNYFCRVFFDYRLSGFIQTSFNYDARVQSSSRVIHTMRAEARAYF